MIEPALEQLKTIDRGDCHLAPLKKEIYADLFTPIMVIKKLKTISSHCFILESNADASQWGRYTFIGFNPKQEFTCKKGRMKYNGKYGVCKNPSNYIRRIINTHKSLELPGFPPLTGGLVGYFSYDYSQYSQPEQNIDGHDDEGFKDVDLMVFDEIICFDHYRQKIALIVNVDLDDLDNDYPRKCQRIEEIETILKFSELEVNDPLRLKTKFKPIYPRSQYYEMVAQAKQSIEEGGLSQVVLSNRFEADCAGSLIDTYRILRTVNPSPYLFYFSSSSMEVAGASPETLIKLEDDQLYTVPITGTKCCGKDDEENQQFINNLMHDDQEIIEHNKLVDLSCRELERISKPQSINKVRQQEILTFSKTIHMATEIQSRILDGQDALDAIETMLPSHTLSGIPKQKAYTLINQLESYQRGLYGGAFGYLDFKGNMDTCMGLHLAYKRKNKVYVRSSANITGDSVKENAYQECMTKASDLIEALHQAKGGID